LFRPAKVSGWSSLRGLALRDGREADARFLRELVNTKGLVVFPKHFVPPILVNALLGTVLWTTYAEASSALANHTHPITCAFLAGGLAGGVQAVVAAPADNIRHAIEGGTGGWSHAWKEVFRDTDAVTPPKSKAEAVVQARRVRDWMQEVGGMAGRGWSGWGWTLAKDVCGFSVFFAIFEGTRHLAVKSTAISQDYLRSRSSPDNEQGSVQRHAPRFVQAATLVAGGVCAGLAYEIVCRPWDAARKLIHLERINSEVEHTRYQSSLLVVAKKVRADGVQFLFTAPYSVVPEKNNITRSRARMNATLRTLGRVGPWGFGFLVWEAYGPGLGIGQF